MATIHHLFRKSCSSTSIIFFFCHLALSTMKTVTATKANIKVRSPPMAAAVIGRAGIDGEAMTVPVVAAIGIAGIDGETMTVAVIGRAGIDGETMT